MSELNYLDEFPFKTIAFLDELSRNNDRNWFKTHRDDYEEKFLRPAQAFVGRIGQELLDVSPAFKAVPRIDGSIFRLHRDVRFSKNKDPYKTHLGLLFWEGPGKKMESSGLYFHVDSKKYFIALGMYQFTREQLKRYRDLVAEEKNAKTLDALMNDISSKGYLFGGKTYKQVPRGFDKEYRFAHLLLQNGIYAYRESDISELRNRDVVDHTLSIFRDLLPLHFWLIEKMV